MEKLEKFLSKYIGPIANYMASSKFFGSLSEAFMRTTPVTLGVALLMIIGNLPIPGYDLFLIEHGLKVHFDSAIGATTGILSIFVVFNFAYVYARKSDEVPLSAGLISLVSFFLLMPQTVESTNSTITAYQDLYTGGTGLFTAIIVGWVSASIYIALSKRNFTIKLPASVPSNVSESLGPSLISMVILSMWFVVRLGFSFTPFGSVFMLIFGILQQPLQALTSNPLSVIIIFTIANLMWFFGIHPNVIYGLVMPMMVGSNAANIAAYQKGEALPFLFMSIVMVAVGNGFGGQGGTYGFILSSLTAKSERYKSLRKLAIIPSIFNINEPLIFGAPIMLNPVFFIPMILSPITMGFTAWGLASLDFLTPKLNPLISMPWTTPALITSALQGGFKYLFILVIVVVVNFIVWFPFFKVADNQAYREETEVK